VTDGTNNLAILLDRIKILVDALLACLILPFLGYTGKGLLL